MTGNQPPYDFNDLDVGATLGITYYPYLNIEKLRTGLFLDFYRGSRIYEDDFHKGDGLGGHSYIKFGVCIVPCF